MGNYLEALRRAWRETMSRDSIGHNAVSIGQGS